MDGKKLLVYLLRFDATVLSLAFVAIFLPRDLMAWSNELLGLAPFPGTPLADYLTRSLAAMYGVRGLFVWLASRDVVRFRPFVLLIGSTNVLLGVLLVAIDLYAGLPLYWVLGEGPGIVFLGLLVHWMTQRYVPESSG